MSNPDFGPTMRRELHVARLEHLRAEMRRRGLPTLVLLDSVSIRYATGAANMENFTTRVPSRYLVLVEPGPAVLFEYRGCEHLAIGLPTIDRVELAEGLNVVSSDDDVDGASRRFADAVAAVVRDADPSIDLIGIDRLPFQAVDALRAKGLSLADADRVLVPARARKLPIEIEFMREAMRRAEASIAEMEQAIVPGATEAEIWAVFHRSLIAREGELMVSRLFQSGARTFPYFQECSTKTVESGDLVCLDTDAVGIEGYSSDLSRAFLCGDVEPTSAQRRLYGLAREQLEHNAALLGPGVSFENVARRAWPIPIEHRQSRYYCIGHGLGVSGDWPNLPHLPESGPYPMPGEFEPGMVFCVESYVGSAADGQGVKLEDEFLITDTGVERISSYPFDARLSS